ncbi:MAG: HAD family hydrolase [Planctomycetota bacterium]|jgi:phosphoglycolate phosphatase-like HAD superfamily hydrolase
MLVLFDIDGTLLLTRRAGLLAMRDAARELFGADFTFDGIDTAGRLDPLIWAEAAAANGVDDAAAQHDRFRATYARRLEARLDDDPTAELLPGVADLVATLGAVDGVTLGLLTGNYPETGRLKISSAGLDPDVFEVAAWGVDGGHRRDLPPVAVERYRRHVGDPPRSIVIIGDTPHDVDCAHANDCLSIAVATGRFERAELEACAPDLTLDDLAEHETVAAWIRRAVETLA